MKKYLLAIITFYLPLQIIAQTVSDVDGNTYDTVTIGTQIWMKENLKTTKYNNSIVTQNVLDDAAWSTLSSGAFCNYEHSNASVSKYGRLYNYYAMIDNNRLCPSGWHVPSIIEWRSLINYLDDSFAGGKLKSTTNDWTIENVGATNESGFTGLPVGFREGYGGFVAKGRIAIFGSTTESSLNSFCTLELHDNSVNPHITEYHEKTMGVSVRCIKDNSGPAYINDFVNEENAFIYPNPTNDKLYIKKFKKDAFISIYDLQGKMVICIQIDSNPINITNLPKGVYVVKIIDSDNIMMNKLIKE